MKMGHAVLKIPSPPHPASQDVETGFSSKSSFSFLQVGWRKRGKSRVWDKDAGNFAIFTKLNHLLAFMTKK